MTTSNRTAIMFGQTHSVPMDRFWRIRCCPDATGKHAWVSRRWPHRLPARLDWWWHRIRAHAAGGVLDA